MRKARGLIFIVVCLTPAAAAAESPASHINIERSIERAVAHDIAAQIKRGDQLPPPPRDVLPQLPDHCSVAKGVAIGAVAGASAGIFSGAVLSSTVRGALVIGAIGAGGGAIAGWRHCR